MKTLVERIRARLAPIGLSATQILDAVRNDMANRGFTEPSGLDMSAIQDRTFDALETIYRESKAALIEHCAMTAKPATGFAAEFVGYLENELTSIANSVAAQIGGAHTPTGRSVVARARSMVQEAKNEVGSA